MRGKSRVGPPLSLRVPFLPLMHFLSVFLLGASSSGSFFQRKIFLPAKPLPAAFFGNLFFRRFIFRHVIIRHIVFRRIVFRRVVSWRVIARYVLSRQVLSRQVLSRHILSLRNVFRQLLPKGDVSSSSRRIGSSSSCGGLSQRFCSSLVLRTEYVLGEDKGAFPLFALNWLILQNDGDVSPYGLQIVGPFRRLLWRFLLRLLGFLRCLLQLRVVFFSPLPTWRSSVDVEAFSQILLFPRPTNGIGVGRGQWDVFPLRAELTHSPTQWGRFPPPRAKSTPPLRGTFPPRRCQE